MVDAPMISAVTTHKIEKSGLNPITCEFSSPRVSGQTISQRSLGSGQVHSLLTPYAGSAVFGNVGKFRVYASQALDPQ